MTNSNKLKEIFADTLSLSLDEVTDQLSPSTCDKWDSVKNLQLLSEIESVFGIELEFEDMVNMTDFGKVKEGLKKYNVNFED